MAPAARSPDPRDGELCALVARGELERATEQTLRAYGAELIGWLCSILRNDAEAHDAFSWMAYELWRSLPRFGGRCSLRTWCYMLARHAAGRVRSQAHHAHEELVSQLPSLVHTVAHLWNTTQRSDQRRQHVYAELRASLDEEDQTLLVLRVDRDLAWRDIAQVLLGEDAAADDVTRKASTLRKQFERIKRQLRELAARKRADEPS
jgi:RNA polymerase sigma-70 factor, ECF subfamily